VTRAARAGGRRDELPPGAARGRGIDLLEQSEVITILRDAIYTVIIASAPMLIVGIVVGLIVSIFQATTQISEQTLAFVPKIVGILLTLLICAGFIMNRLTGFILRVYEYIDRFAG
jgi:flagellar biosynthetic protein FliQ